MLSSRAMWSWRVMAPGSRKAAKLRPTRARIDALLELKFEVSRGKLFWSEETRRMVLAMLLENVGLDAAVRLGDPARWREAVAALDAAAGDRGA